ncbi:MarR family winged helix-turn-helix transcriptional regulator [Pseudooceanicola spongiae]|uniref:MarR family transcriptional regulator n=1 Tax=Pseudooceanicola spongiae TaxID=2613965 RepID=A0A7M3V2R0_9RHOB|nr:MarR family transcriptional regulator [Pseudooceanicola spongiae]QOL79373.1 MarR family transcriptional regulator [Pseudooceanicola spongiae]
MLKRAQHAMRQNMDRKLKDLELSAPQYSVLTSIEGEPDASIARLAFVSPQTMQAMFVKLEQAGLIARAPDAERGRILRTALTHQGREILALARVAASKSEQIAREAASDDAVHILRRIAEVLS